MTSIIAQWFFDWFGVLYLIFRRTALLMVEGESLFDPTPPHLQLVNSLGELCVSGWTDLVWLARLLLPVILGVQL